MSQIDKIIAELPNKVKKNTQIDEKLKKFEEAKKLEDKEKLLKEIKKELQEQINVIQDNKEKKKLQEILNQIDNFKNQFKKLKASIVSTHGLKIEEVEVDDNIEDSGLFGKDNKQWGGFLRKIIKWFETLFVPASSIEKISKTFSKLGYGDEKVIKKVLNKIGDIKLKDIDKKLENLQLPDENINNSKGGFLKKVLDIFDTFKDFFSGDNKINTNEEKIVAIRILYTIKLNKEFLSQNVGVIDIIKKGLNSEKGNLNSIFSKPKFTISKALEKMFSHGWSDWFRDYALPVEGVKLLKFSNSQVNNEIKHETKGNKDIYFIGNSKIEFDKNNKQMVIDKGGKKYKFSKIMLGSTVILENSDIEQIEVKNDKIILRSTSGKEYTINLDKIKRFVNSLGDNNLSVSVSGVNIVFEKFS